MRFLITLNMPSYSGNLVHQINAEHPAESLEEFVDILTSNDFVIIEEFYKDQQTGMDNSRGKMAINYRFVGKVKVMNSGYESQRKDRYEQRPVYNSEPSR